MNPEENLQVPNQPPIQYNFPYPEQPPAEPIDVQQAKLIDNFVENWLKQKAAAAKQFDDAIAKETIQKCTDNMQVCSEAMDVGGESFVIHMGEPLYLDK